MSTTDNPTTDHSEAYKMMAELLGVPEDQVVSKLRSMGYQFMIRDGWYPLAEPFGPADACKPDDIELLWPHLVPPVRFYYDALAHVADADAMTDEEKMDALLEWRTASNEAIHAHQFPEVCNVPQAMDGAYLHRIGYRVYESKPHSTSLEPQYQLPATHEWLLTRRLDWTDDHGMPQMMRIGLYRVADAQEMEIPDALTEVMTGAEVAEVFNVDHGTVRVSIHRGYLPARKSGGTWLILRADAEKRWEKRDSRKE